MLKTIGWLMFLVLTAVAADAQTYRCRRADGRLIFTDDPGKFPPGCREVPDEKKKGGVSFVPLTPPPAKPLPSAEATGEQGDKAEPGEKPPPTLKEQAVALAEEYREATSRRIHSLKATEARKVRGSIATILKQRDDLREKVASAPLSAAEKSEIEQILGGIADSGY